MKLYVEHFHHNEENWQVPVTSAIVLFVHKFIESNVEICSVIVDDSNARVVVDLNPRPVVVDVLPEIVKTCQLPSLVIGNVLISGLCAVVRKLVKHSNYTDLLGFRESSLMACSEVSVWTKFCEVDMPEMVDGFFSDPHVDLTAFEGHLNEPVRIHNYYKIKQQITDDVDVLFDGLKISDLSDFVDTFELNENFRKNVVKADAVPHTFAEGPFLTISDLILFAEIYLVLKTTPVQLIETVYSKIFAWITRVLQIPRVKDALSMFKSNALLPNKAILQPTTNKPTSSLYKSDPSRYQPKSRLFTKQKDIDKITAFVQDNLKIIDPTEPFGFNTPFTWDVPETIHPGLGGKLPASRFSRKCEQLENLAKAVMGLSKSGDTIVDFCSGTGHLGLLLAYLLPECHVVIVENKERNVECVSRRVEECGFRNVTLLQCNLGFFRGAFDIGTSLHACGVATDLVINTCIRARASFVCCPCCYGGVHDSPTIKYPRSDVFRASQIASRDYFVLAHTADQTHDAENVKTAQGHKCMTIIDNDRVRFAEQHGYVVWFGRLVPSDCTPKNHLLVGCRG